MPGSRRTSLAGSSARVLSCIACALFISSAGSHGAWQSGGAGHHLSIPWGTPPLSPIAIGDQGPPPPVTPAILQAFFDLLASYEAIGSNIPVSFGEWIVMNGIVDLRTQWCLMWLWWTLTNQSAVD